jgi:hypothetical protein
MSRPTEERGDTNDLMIATQLTPSQRKEMQTDHRFGHIGMRGSRSELVFYGFLLTAGTTDRGIVQY